MLTLGDPKLNALSEAASAWANTLYQSSEQRIRTAKDLHTYGLFSLNQLAKIVRLTPGGVSRHCAKNDNTGGRFQPEALSVLVHLRKGYLAEHTVNANLVQAAVDAGCSASCIAALTGINYPAVYYANKARKK